METAYRPVLRLKLRTARRLSVAVLLALGIGYLGGAIATDPPRWLFVGIGLLRIFGLIGAVALFVDSTGQHANAPDRLLDERQRHERDRAYVLSYQIMVISMFAAFLYTIPAQVLDWWLPQIPAAIDLLSAFGITSLALPGIILAWRAVESD
ncbi:MAG: hypothetical protein DCF31_17010 [Alphaproteobacteria bacterium]|nr:MAG: hypothetical protein DCF31_17010 [Alphaproteobacteria bacterium]